VGLLDEPPLGEIAEQVRTQLRASAARYDIRLSPLAEEAATALLLSPLVETSVDQGWPARAIVASPQESGEFFTATLERIPAAVEMLAGFVRTNAGDSLVIGLDIYGWLRERPDVFATQWCPYD